MQLYKHQQDIADQNPKQTGFWLGTGTGKSALALFLAKGKTLVICPKTLKEDQTWERQLSKMNKKLNLTVVSKEAFRRDVHELPSFDTVIIDEAHTLLGMTPNTRQVNKVIIPRSSQLYDEFKAYIERIQPERIYLCTASIMKSAMTVYAAGIILGKKWDFYKWRNAFYIRLPMPGREVWVQKKDIVTKKRLAAAARKIGYVGRLEDYFDVPEQTFKTIYVSLTPTQEKVIKQLRYEFPEPIVRVGKTHQVENGSLAGNEFALPHFFKNEKIDKILELADEFPRMIVFAKYTHQIENIRYALEKDKKDVFVMDGKTKDRKAVLDELKNKSEYIFIVQSQISAGWELPDCGVMVFASCSYSFVDRQQAEGRVQRANSIKKNLYIDLVVKNGIDEEVVKCLSNKQDFNEKLFAGTLKK